MRNIFFLTYKDSILPAIFVLICLLSIITIFSPHIEIDELIYQFLAIKLASFQSYTLQGSPILPHLPQHMYNTPIFFRPPAFMIYLAILYRLLGTIGLRLSSIIVFAVLLITIYKTVFLLTKSQNNALKSLILTAVSSLLLFSSFQIHLDMFMTLMIALSFYFLVLSRETHKGKDVLLSGLFLSLAALTNYTALLYYPFYLILLALYRQKKIVRDLFLFLLPSLMVIAWLYFMLISQHMSIASLIASPNKNGLAKFPFVNYAYHRPFYFYFVSIFLVNPVYFFIFLLFKKNILSGLKSQYGKIFYFLLSIILFSLLALTFFGIRGGTYQMRYIMIAEPFLIILLSLIPFEEFSVLWKLFWAFVAYNALIVSFNIMWQTAEIFSFLEWLFLYSR